MQNSLSMVGETYVLWVEETRVMGFKKKELKCLVIMNHELPYVRRALDRLPALPLQAAGSAITLIRVL
jgi:hypothetical protein